MSHLSARSDMIEFGWPCRFCRRSLGDPHVQTIVFFDVAIDVHAVCSDPQRQRGGAFDLDV